MARWWKEVWSSGNGDARMYCGIARTRDGYAVDVFRGDTCVGSEIYASRPEAERAAGGCVRRFLALEPSTHDAGIAVGY